MAELKNENYIAIQSFMVKDLELNGNELIAYALIYGFSQDGESYFKGSLSYVSEWLNCSRATACSILNKLADDGFLEKKEKVINGVKLCDYMAINPDTKTLKIIKERKKERKKKEKTKRYSKNLNTHSKNFNEGVQKTLTHNSIDILDENIEKVNTAFSEKSPRVPEKKTKSELIKLEKDMFERFKLIGREFDVTETAYKNITRAFNRYMAMYRQRTGKIHPILQDETLDKIFMILSSISDFKYHNFADLAAYEPDENGISYLDKMVDEHFNAEHKGDTNWHISHFAVWEYLEKMAQHIVEY